MGGRGGSGSFGFSSINATRSKIANLKKEQLFVFSPSGDLLYKEQGTAQHTGYGDADYMLSMGGAFFLHDSLRNDRWMRWVAEELSGRRASRPFSLFTKGMQRC